MNRRKIVIRAVLVVIGLPSVGLARFRIFQLRFLLPELDQRHRRYHHFLRPEAEVPAVRPKELRPCETGAACHYPSHLDVMG